MQCSWSKPSLWTKPQTRLCTHKSVSLRKACLLLLYRLPHVGRPCLARYKSCKHAHVPAWHGCRSSERMWQCRIVMQSSAVCSQQRSSGFQRKLSYPRKEPALFCSGYLCRVLHRDTLSVFVSTLVQFLIIYVLDRRCASLHAPQAG